MKSWILAARPKTLLAGVVPVWLGCALAWRLGGVFDGWLALCTLLSALGIQVATNLFNDAIDFEKGADGAGRVGPRRVTASGDLSGRAVMGGGVLVLLVACALAVPLIQARGWPILAIGIPSLYFSYGYTGGPMPLAYRGMGELFVILFFGLVAVTGTYFVQTGDWSWEAMVLGFQVGCLSTVMIAVNNLRDVDEDRASGKRTLAVRWGKDFARKEIMWLSFAAILSGGHWVYGEEGLWAAGVWPLAMLPLTLVMVAGVFREEPGPKYNRFLGMAAGQLLLFAVLFTIGLGVFG
ncbi:MAG: 1,4-dihydroxy-2-naphthoate octaprenyltransferase [Verrucomicrobiota bacterium]